MAPAEQTRMIAKTNFTYGDVHGLCEISSFSIIVIVDLITRFVAAVQTLVIYSGFIISAFREPHLILAFLSRLPL